METLKKVVTMSIFSSEDLNVLLRAEIAKLRRQKIAIAEDRDYWKFLALEAQADRDCLREQLQEAQNHE